MLDIWLLNALLNAVKPHSRLVLVGDVNQLPSVGTGQTLHDIIASQAIPVTRLTRIYRQAQNPSIIQNAHRINSASLPISSEQQTLKDSVKTSLSSIERAKNNLYILYCTSYKRKYLWTFSTERCSGSHPHARWDTGYQKPKSFDSTTDQSNW